MLTIWKTGFRGTHKKAFCGDEKACRLWSAQLHWIHCDFLKDQITNADKERKSKKRCHEKDTFKVLILNKRNMGIRQKYQELNASKVNH